MENQKVRLTKGVVADAEPRHVDYVIWDSTIPGFGLRVRKSGAKAFTFVYRAGKGRASKVKRVTIGGTDKMALETARGKAKELSGQHHGGADPAAEEADRKREAERQSRAPTLADVLDNWIRLHVRENLKDKTAGEYERIADKILKPRLGKVKVDDLAPAKVAEMYRAESGKPTQAALAVRVLSSAMSWAEEAGMRQPGPNPARIRTKGSRRRQRLFSDTEVARLLATIDRMEGDKKLLPSVALGLRLLFATGCRAGEICALEWENVDLDEGLLRWPDSKTGYLEKPITDEARALLESAERIVGVPWVCPSPLFKRLRVETLEAGFERVMKAAKVKANENASLHLIRHWFATKTYTDKSIPLPLQMAIVGHGSVATAMRYAHVGREELKRAAADAAKRRATAIEKAHKAGEVVTLKGGAA